MDEFKKAKTDILISTSVVEVGVDIPNATVMIIEGSDRFGLAQLHQFRGRIGRGKIQSYCFLFTDSNAKKTHQRLKAMLTAKDGFELAEKDLKIRGAGDFIGTRQWGLPDLAMASLNNLELIKKTRQAARIVLKNNLINKNLELKLKNINKDVHLEYYFFLGVTQNPIYFPSIKRVCASSPGIAPKIRIVKGTRIH